jgi:hypothetical protein
MSPCPEPWGPSQLTAALTAQIVNLDASGLSLRQIAARTAVSTATARVALGWVTPPVAVSVEPAATNDDVIATVVDTQDLELVAAAVVDLVVLAAPVPRGPERAAARFGELVEAPVVITQGAQLPLAGLLLALPVLEMTGLLAVATAVFPPMKKGFYGLRVTLLMGVFMALLREPRAEGATRIRPADLMGRLLSLDRAPEVKTLRRKLAELAGYGRGAQLQGALASHHATTRPDAVGFLYLDGHVRVYTGTLALPKTHIARMRIAGPATEESWARCATTDFTTMGFTAPRRDRPHLRARRTPHRPTPARPATTGQDASTASILTLRLIVRRSPDGHQTPILTNRTDLSAPQVAYRMATRWRQENYFKYAREHFAPDALDSYSAQPDDPDRLVPNPAKARALTQVAAIEEAGVRARQPGSDWKATVDPVAATALSAAEDDLATAKAASRATTSHLPLGQVRPGSRLLETERNLLTHAIRMSAYNTESALARLIRPHYSRGQEGARPAARGVHPAR